MSRDQPLIDIRSGVLPSLEDHLAEWSRRTGIAVEVWALPKEPLAARITEIVHGTIDDTLAEVERQGLARTVSLALTVAAGGLRLTIGDDGGGRQAEVLTKCLLIRRAQLVALGGGLTVNGVPGEGTTVSATVPRTGLGR
jgi:signal transduction histidine kinase